MKLDLIYCASGQKTLATIAVNSGFLYGSQLPGTVYFAPYFADQDWLKPDLHSYAAEIKQHKPVICTVLDLEEERQYQEVLNWAEEVAPFTEQIIIIPKVFGIISKIPRTLGNKPIVLGYSVPTRYGGTSVPVWEFDSRPTHLLGGSPHRQMALSYYLNVSSADGNMHQMMAVRHCKFWKDGRWHSLEKADGQKWNDGGEGAYVEAFRRSCKNILKEWKAL